MTAFPTLSVRVALATDPYATTPTWTEIGPASGAGPGSKGWVRSIKAKRGRERLLRSQAQFQAGTLNCSLDNRDRRFDPTNSSGPYWPNIQPEKLIQVGATWSSTFYPIWTGYVDDWPQHWPGFSEAEVPLIATDLFKHLAIARLINAGYENSVISEGPIAYYRLGDPIGSTTAADSSGYGRTAAVSGPVTFGESGAMPADTGTAALLPAPSGSNPAGMVLLPDMTTFLGGYGLTIECWIKQSAGTGNDFAVLFPGTPGGYPLQLGTSTGLPFFSYSASEISAPFTIDDGHWHHLAGCFTYGGSAHLYVDGDLLATGSGVPASSVYDPLSGTIASLYDEDDLTLQEVALYDYPLTGLEIAEHFSLGNWPAQFTGQMFLQILNTLGLPSTFWNVDTGYTFCQADTQSETQTKVLDQLQKLEQTEQGQCFVAANGELTFQDRYRRYRYPNSTPTVTLGDGGSSYPSEIPYAMGGVILNFDRTELYNDVPVTRRGGNLQEAVDQTSIGLFTNRTMTGLSDLLMATDVDALGCAEWVLADTAYPQYLIGDLVLNPMADSRLWPLVLGYDIGQVITVNKHHIPGTGPALSLVCRIEGIEHQIDPPLSWITTWHVSLAGTLPWFILDDPVAGLLDMGNRWGW